MRIALLSDIHSNLAAFQAVADDIDRFGADVVWLNGDIVNRGPSPAACWALACQKRDEEGWKLFRGNHEDYVLTHVEKTAVADGPVAEINRMSAWTYDQLGHDTAKNLALPDGTSLELADGVELRLRHASMRHNRDGIFATTPADVVREQIAPAPAYFATGHIHQGFVRRVDDTTITNAGSVGQPNDRDVRASYARMIWDGTMLRSEVVRVPYDRAAAGEAFQTSGWFEGAGPVGRLLYEEWRRAEPVMVPWMRQYRAAVIAGEITLERSVDAALKDT